MRLIRDPYEQVVFEQLKPYLKGLRPTVGSGAKFGDQDLFSDTFRISCKLRTNKGLTYKEILEPFNCEAVNRSRVPATFFRHVMTHPINAATYFDTVILSSSGLAQVFSVAALNKATSKLEQRHQQRETWINAARGKNSAGMPGLGVRFVQEVCFWPEFIWARHGWPVATDVGLIMAREAFETWAKALLKALGKDQL